MFKFFSNTGTDSKFYKLRKFLAGDLFNMLPFLAAIISICTNQYVCGTIAIGIIISFILVVSDDVISAFPSLLLLVAIGIQAKNSYDDYMSKFWFILIPIAACVFHCLAYRKSADWHKGKLFYPILIISIVNILGGVGIITWKEYTTTLSLAYMFALGFMILIMYWYFSATIAPGKNYTDSIDVRIGNMMSLLTVFLILAVGEYYIEHWAEFIADPGILPFQWRNNASTLIMIAMPFTFYMASKHFAYILIPLGSVAALVLSGSRGGLVMGGLEFLVLMIYFAVKDKKHRWAILGILAAGIIAVGLMIPKMLDFLSYTIGRFTSSKENFRRIGLWKRSVTDFLSNPLFGRGLGYMGNRDLHPSSTATLCWYHSSLPQVIGSFGIAGILGYGYQMYARFKLLLKRTSLFSRSVMLSFIGLELMSLVNPGIFVPMYLLLITILFVCVENYEKEVE